MTCVRAARSLAPGARDPHWLRPADFYRSRLQLPLPTGLANPDTVFSLDRMTQPPSVCKSLVRQAIACSIVIAAITKPHPRSQGVAKSFHALDGYYRRARAVASLALHVTSMNARRSWQRVTGSDFLRGHRPNEWTNELKQVCEKQNCAPRGIGGPTRACNGFD